MRFKILSVIAVAGFLAACAGPGGVSGGASGGYLPGSQNVSDRVFFDFDKYNLKPEARNVLQQQAAWLAANGSIKVVIEGHCDERGTREYNLALGERRAASVADYLMVLGVPQSRIQTVSYGKERPEDPASNEAAWAKNRRSVTVVK